MASCNLRSRTHSEAWGPPKKRQSSWASNLWCKLQDRWRQGKQLFGRRSVSGTRGGLNGSTQPLLEVYSQESESLRFFSGVDLSAALFCPDPTGYTRTGLFSSGSIVVIAHSCFRSSRAAKGFEDHRNRLSHPWPP